MKKLKIFLCIILGRLNPRNQNWRRFKKMSDVTKAYVIVIDRHEGRSSLEIKIQIK